MICKCVSYLQTLLRPFRITVLVIMMCVIFKIDIFPLWLVDKHSHEAKSSSKRLLCMSVDYPYFTDIQEQMNLCMYTMYIFELPHIFLEMHSYEVFKKTLHEITLKLRWTLLLLFSVWSECLTLFQYFIWKYRKFGD